MRRELYNLAQVLPECWAVNRKTVAFTPDEHTRVDLYLLLELKTMAHWDEAAGLLAGEFLEGLYLEQIRSLNAGCWQSARPGGAGPKR